MKSTIILIPRFMFCFTSLFIYELWAYLEIILPVELATLN